MIRLSKQQRKGWKKAPKKATRQGQATLFLGPHNSYVVNDSWQSVDQVNSINVASATGRQSIFAAIATLLATVPQITSPIAVNGSVQWRQRVQVHALELYNAWTGSQGTALVAGDLYNYGRILAWETRDNYSVGTTEALSGVHLPLNLVDARRVFYDKVVALPSHAFNAGDYNVPGLSSERCIIPVNQTFDWFTTVAGAASGWDTKSGNIYISYVSDSTATPHPVLNFSVRIYFRLLKAGSNSNAGQ